MNFDFDATQRQLGEEARRFLVSQSQSMEVRRVLDGERPYHAELWSELGQMGFTGAAIPEEYGGSGFGYLELCVLAQELGRTVAAVPFSSTVYLFAELIKAAGSERQKREWLPRVASAEIVGTVAWAEGAGPLYPDSIATTAFGGQLTGSKKPVLDGPIADVAVVIAREQDDPAQLSLFTVALDHPNVSRTALECIDPTRGLAAVTFEHAPAERLGQRGDGMRLLSDVFDKAAVLVAFEQVGGAERALEMACDYAKMRFAFGRPIGSFQALKHMMADMYVSTVLARSNAYYGAWALSADAPVLPEAAAFARVGATWSYQQCAKDNIQVHGGMGFTWEADCHLHYRRSNLLALMLGGTSEWESKLITNLTGERCAVAKSALRESVR
ncbi:acyl-CoA dehydrogenase family protein (plasmid) [Sphingobium sp. SJ10-10]|uniref:acyl-CoA dehydrogenase family protein n=1 Tax=Sphingobium sp. SJ10-10 TaxID=3114999 RepID=UPI002E187924|nr:acyl-CoA dehydrogenase family protein [Sphingobium sp. SJ10-10]